MTIPIFLKEVIRTVLYSYRFPRDILFCFIKVGNWNKSWRLYGLPIIKVHRKASLIIGGNFVACSNPHYNSIGVFQKVTIKVLSPNASLIIGNNVGMSGNSISCSSEIRIGNNVLLGSGTVITDSDAHPIHPDRRDVASEIGIGPVIIEDDVFIGARAIILKGVTVGRGSVVGAGSVVSKSVPPMVIVAGNPAKVVKKII